jgi:hypothetical protein
MTEPGERLRELLRTSTEPPAMDRDQVLAGVYARQALLARRRSLLRWAMTGLGTAAVALAVYVGSRLSARVPSFENLSPVTTDSVPQSPSGDEVMVTHQEASTPSSLIPLLPHRNQLRMDIDHLMTQRRELTMEIANDKAPAASRELAKKELVEVEQDLAAAKRALNVIDAELAGRPVIPVAIEEPVQTHTFTEIPVGVPVVVGRPVVAWIAGASTLVLLVMLSMMLWVRRTTRAALSEVASLRTQSGTQMTALSEGIEAIALEVERIGEGQRYLSKMIATPQEAAPQPRQ